jgi:hypothetical protein
MSSSVLLGVREINPWLRPVSIELRPGITAAALPEEPKWYYFANFALFYCFAAD